jgi:hypothetical protein
MDDFSGLSTFALMIILPFLLEEITFFQSNSIASCVQCQPEGTRSPWKESFMEVKHGSDAGRGGFDKRRSEEGETNDF